MEPYEEEGQMMHKCKCEDVGPRLDRLEELIGGGIFALAVMIATQGEEMSAELDELNVNVADLQGKAGTIVSLIGDLNTKVADLEAAVAAGADPAAVKAAADAVAAVTAELSNVIPAPPA